MVAQNGGPPRTGHNILRRCGMYAESKELSKFRAELIAGGFSEGEAFQIVATYFDAKLDTRQTEEGMIYLVAEQTDIGDGDDG